MEIRQILDAYKSGELSVSDAEKLLRLDYLDSLSSDILFDNSRELRKGIPEVVYARSKTPIVVEEIVTSSKKDILIISKATREHLYPLTSIDKPHTLYYDYGLGVIGNIPEPTKGTIGIITAGTSDIPIAMEAKVMAEAMGVRSITAFDVGVAGIHRIIEPMKKMIEESVDAIVVVAGMEGALPTVVSSLSPVPVIGVPTSTGYGYGGNGEAALMSMLQTCSPGLTVVNIDNGIGAGATAALISRNSKK